MYDDPDLYNPVWINMTLVFCLIVVSNISWYLKTKENFHFDYKVVPKAFNIIWGLAFIVPCLSTLFFFIFGFSISFKTIVSIFAIYSYSNIYFILASLITIIPVRILQWAAIGFAGFLSLVFISLNYNKFIEKFPNHRKKFILVFLTIF